MTTGRLVSVPLPVLHYTLPWLVLERQVRKVWDLRRESGFWFGHTEGLSDAALEAVSVIRHLIIFAEMLLEQKAHLIKH
jgi:hypothetical protein